MRGWMGRQWGRETRVLHSSQEKILIYFTFNRHENMQGTVLGRHQEEKKSINTSPKWEKP